MYDTRRCTGSGSVSCSAGAERACDVWQGARAAGGGAGAAGGVVGARARPRGAPQAPRRAALEPP